MGLIFSSYAKFVTKYDSWSGVRELLSDSGIKIMRVTVRGGPLNLAKGSG